MSWPRKQYEPRGDGPSSSTASEPQSEQESDQGHIALDDWDNWFGIQDLSSEDITESDITD